MLNLARKVATTSASVLLRGETGTGKEVVAQYIHDQSPRASAPFIKVNCASLTESLLASELFGHEKGAFTDAKATRQGRFELAHGGTILLDEIGDISPKLQVSLLRILQEGEVYRVGGNKPVSIDVRIIASTHCNLDELVRLGKFREDLFYRLNIFPIHIPSLRERTADIPHLIRHFIAKYEETLCPNTTIDVDDIIKNLVDYNWPGNIRELENAVQRGLIIGAGEPVDSRSFGFLSTALQNTANSESTNTAQTATETWKRNEIKRIREALFDSGGNVSRAARRLGMPRATLANKAKRYGLR